MSTPWRHHWQLDPDLAFLNHGSFGATPRVVLEAQARLRARMEANPVDFFARFLPVALTEARRQVADWIHADPEGLVFVPNASSGVATVLANATFGPGDELLVTDHAYGACKNAFALAAQRSGARVVTAHIPFPGTTAEAIVASVLAAVTERTRLVMLDHVTSPTGLVFPLEALLPHFAARGIEVLIDGAHAPGMVDVDIDHLATLGLTYYAANGHKWPCAAKGAALLWVHAARRDGFHPLVISHGLTAPLAPGQSRFRAEHDWTGTSDPSPYLTWPDAVAFIASLDPQGWAGIRKRNHDLTVLARDRIATALQIAAPADDALLGSLASFPLPPDLAPELDAMALHTRLFREHRVELPIFPWPAAGQRVLRIAIHLHSDLDDVARLIEALATLR
ncbi:MAG: aminotransferase class V-fold PLP-dependent enzyme [Deltaproteobacteria bacterium]|nr:aminotransferase class V-fold PLP-dependent enzyme [Deltaproteobacteria bacterium]